MAEQPTEGNAMKDADIDKYIDAPMTEKEKDIMDGYAPVDDPEEVAKRIDELNKKFGK